MKEQEKQLPILVFEDSQAIDATKERLSMIQRAYENLFIEYAKLGLGELNPIELQPLVSNPYSFVQNKCLERVPEQPSIGGFKVRREALLDQLELPEISALQSAIPATRRYPDITMYDFDFKDGKAIVKKEKLHAVTETNRIYATNSTEKEAAETYAEFRAAYEKLDKLLKPKGSGLMHYTRHKLFSGLNVDSYDFNPNFYSLLIR